MANEWRARADLEASRTAEEAARQQAALQSTLEVEEAIYKQAIFVVVQLTTERL
jgi:hypothetical protein